MRSKETKRPQAWNKVHIVQEYVYIMLAVPLPRKDQQSSAFFRPIGPRTMQQQPEIDLHAGSTGYLPVTSLVYHMSSWGESQEIFCTWLVGWLCDRFRSTYNYLVTKKCSALTLSLHVHDFVSIFLFWEAQLAAKVAEKQAQEREKPLTSLGRWDKKDEKGNFFPFWDGFWFWMVNFGLT